MHDPAPSPARIGALELFVAFTRLTLHSFGGALFWSRRMLVENRRWLSEHEFVELLSLAQLLPGANGVNMAVLVGYRFAGTSGAAAAVAGFMGAPCILVIGLGVLHQHYGELPLVRHALSGMATVAVGLLIAMALKMTAALQRRPRAWAFGLLAFAGVGVMRWPLLAVLAVLAPWAIGLAWKGRG
jgi:chromate transporter